MRISLSELAKNIHASFARTDGVLLEVHNQECRTWSLIATTSQILALRLSLLQTLLSISLVCFEALLDFPKHCLHIIHSQPSVLFGSHASLSYSSSFLVLLLPFINLRMRFLLREEGCNTPYYSSPNYSLITFIRSLIMH
jgi:hypothetical protein